jgi:hypothetical protein
VVFISGALDGAGTASGGATGSTFLFPHIGLLGRSLVGQKALAFGPGCTLYSSVSRWGKKKFMPPVRDSNANVQSRWKPCERLRKSPHSTLAAHHRLWCHHEEIRSQNASE